MTNEQIRQLTDTIYRVLFNADGAALRIKLGLPPADSDDVTDDDLRDEMGGEAIEVLGNIEDEMAAWMESHPFAGFSKIVVTTRKVARTHGNYARKKAIYHRIDLLTGHKKDEKC